MSIVVELTASEVMVGVMLAASRQIAAFRRKAKPFNGADPLNWNATILGVLGEMGAAKAFDIWNFPQTTYGKDCDLRGLQVRSTDRPTNSLIIHDKELCGGDKTDPDNENFVLVIVERNRTTLVGWINAGEAKAQAADKGWIREPREDGKAIFVPQSALHPMETCPRPQLQVG